MLTYNIQEHGSIPIYDFLYRCIKEDILSGKLNFAEKLPSKRSLSEHLKISVITVENAYAQLIAEGYIYSLPKKGYYVSKIEKQNTVQAPSAEGTDEKAETENKNNLLIDFSSNGIRTDCFPFSVWAKLMREVLLEKDKKLLSEIPKNGVYELRKSISVHLSQFRGMTVSPEQIILGAGTDYLYNILIQLLGRELTFALEEPGYKKISEIYKINKVKEKFIKLDDSGISMDELYKSGADIIHISPSHHYPTGIITPIGRRQELLAWADKSEKRYIIEDEYDSEFRFSGKPIPPLQSIDRNGKVIYINTFSKTISPSIRISYLVLPKALLQKYNRLMGFYSCTVPVFEQYTLAKFISKGYFEQHINRVKNLYRASRNAVIKSFESGVLQNIVTIKEADAGLHFLINVNTEKDDFEIKKDALKKGIGISSLSEFLHSPEPKFEHCFIINYSGIEDLSVLDKASLILRSCF